MNWDGLLLLNKPEGETSHAVVQAVRKRLQISRAGHLGTLDPIATGVFPMCIGKATRLAHFYMKADKSYLTAVRFGFSTTTDDREGEQEGQYRKPDFSGEQLRRVIGSFQGEYDQVAPAYSAKKIAGERAYRLARKGAKPAMPVQKVQIYEIKLVHFEADIAMIYISCSSGTYVRSIARDLGRRMRCGAHVHELTRTKFGEYGLEQSCDPEAPLTELQRSFVPVERMLTHFPEWIVDAATARRIAGGSAVDAPGKYEQGWVRIFRKDGVLLALAEVQVSGDSRRVQPRIVFA
jgi:tRNA pseudouridine55 synthase